MILDKGAFGIRGLMLSRVFKTTFKRENQEVIKKYLKGSLSEKEVSIYIHFPFCKSLCPACPYVRYLYSEKLVSKYIEAMQQEMKLYGRLLSDLDLKITDIHVGGGSPSLLAAEEYAKLRESLNQYFRIGASCRFGIEANPEDLVEDRVFQLRDAGVSELSIGVQSFFIKNLRMLGRRHSVEDSLRAIDNSKKAGFDLVNIDMMYFLPNQTIHEWIQDLKLAVEQDTTQITLYPLLIVHYRPMYKMMKQGRMPHQPTKKEFKAMYGKAIDVLNEGGFKPVRYYSFSKVGREYSTVEREMVGPLLGFGSGAMGFTGASEYVNTCSVEEYIRVVLSEQHFPIAGIRPVNKEERMIRWTIERLGTLKLHFDDFRSFFGEEFHEAIKRTAYHYSLKMDKLLGNLKEHRDHLELTRKGMFVRNFSGWAFVLLVPCGLVQRYLETAWPLEVTIP